MEKLPESDINDKYLRARKRVDDLKNFYYHLVAYCLVIPFLIFINYKTYWGFQWFWFPVAGWALGLGFHAFSVFVDKGILGRRWEGKKIQEFMDEEEEKMRWG